MTIDEIREDKKALEARLRNVATEVVDEFQRRTGLCVTGVDIGLVDVTNIGDKVRRSRVTETRLVIEI
jgi:hypothetical protein